MQFLPSNKVQNLENWNLIQTYTLPLQESYLHHLRHKVTDTNLFFFDNPDTNKVFMATFQTIIDDSSGVPHILEHSLLNGSQAFPTKEPFVHMMKGSVNTFLNAMTGSDRTYYPVSSENHQDFFNLTSVYLDAVFRPLLGENIFLQEGIRIEIDPKTKDLSFNGIVFNEMKAYLSDPDYIFLLNLRAELFQGTLYQYESGGYPMEISSLSYKRFLDFYKTYYHPSNADLYLYGDVDLDRQIKLIDDYLKDHTKSKRFLLPKIPDLSSSKNLQVNIPDNGTNTGSVGYGWLLADSLDLEQRLVWQLILDYWVGSDNAVLKKALLGTKLGLGLSYTSLETDESRMSLIIAMNGVKPENLELAAQAIWSEIEKVINLGWDDQKLLAILDNYEFNLRENQSSGYPNGLSMAIAISNLVNKGLDIERFFGLNDLENLRTKIKLSTKFLTQLTIKELLESVNFVKVVGKPDKNFAKTLEDQEKQALQDLKHTLDQSELEKLESKINSFKDYQNTQDRPEDIAKIPQLYKNDLDRKIKQIPHRLFNHNDIRIITTKSEINGVVYLNIQKEILHLNSEIINSPNFRTKLDILIKILPFYEILTSAYTLLGTQKFSPENLEREIFRLFGGLSIDLGTTTNLQNEVILNLSISAKFLEKNQIAAMELLSEILTNVDFSKSDILIPLIGEWYQSLQTAFSSGSYQIVVSLMNRFHNTEGVINDFTDGYGYFKTLKELCTFSYPELADILSKHLSEINQLIWSTSGQIQIAASSSDSEKIISLVKATLAGLIKRPKYDAWVSFGKNSSNHLLYWYKKSLDGDIFLLETNDRLPILATDTQNMCLVLPNAQVNFVVVNWHFKTTFEKW